MTRVFITVKTYPLPSQTYEEIVCTAGFREGGGFVRLYPVVFRRLPFGQQYAKYQWVEVDLRKNSKDPRPESFRPNLETMRTIGSPVRSWEARRALVLPHAVPSIEVLQERQALDGTSLGLIRPAEVSEMTVRRCEKPDWSPRALARIEQANLFGPQLRPLRKVPWYFRYKFRCDDDRCSGHELMVEDWELGALYFKMLDRHSDAALAAEKVRQKFLVDLCWGQRDVHFFVGNTPKGPRSWTVVGVFYPPREDQLRLPL